MSDKLFRFFVRHSTTMLAVGSSMLLTGAAMAAIPHVVAGTTPGFGARDAIMTLLALVTALGGAFFTGAKKELERVDAMNAAGILEVKAIAAENAKNHANLQTLLLTNYRQKDEITAQLAHLESSFTRELQGLHRLMEAKFSER